MQREISWFLSSNPALGAQNVSKNGSYFEIYLQEPFSLPSNCTNVTCELQSAVVWNSQFNITTGINDLFYYSTTLIAGGGTTDHVVVLDAGNYDLTSLNLALQILMRAATPDVAPGGFNLGLRGAYAVIELIIRPGGTRYISRIQMGQPQDCSRIIGFLPQDLLWTIPPVVGTGLFFFSDLAPAIKDGVRDWFLSTTLVNRGIRINSTFNSVLATLNFADCPPGSQLLFEPPNPKPVFTDLSGGTIGFVASYLTDVATGLPVNTNGEYWSFIAILRYEIPIAVPKVIVAQEGAGSKKRKLFSLH